MNQVLFLVSLFILFSIAPTNIHADERDYSWYKVTRIVDGDTLRINVNGKSESVRLYGIDAPERDKAGYHKASAALEDLCFGKMIRLVYPQRNHRDKFGRLLAEVFLRDGTRVNEELYHLGVVKLFKRSPLAL